MKRYWIGYRAARHKKFVKRFKKIDANVMLNNLGHSKVANLHRLLNL